MMGLGYLGSSSSSSSSNLSPLAPPFTVGRSNHNKPNLNSNPVVSHFNDPSYGVPSWPYSQPSTSRQEFFSDSPTTATVPSNDCMYMIPEHVNPPTAHNWSALNSNVKSSSHWSAVNPRPKPVTDSFSYNLGESKPFYPPYASLTNNDDIPLVTVGKPSYDLLSTSGLVLGDDSSQVDYTRSLSGLEYNPLREGLWSLLPEGKQGKKMESDDSFFSEEANVVASLAYKDYLNQGAYGAETLSKGKEDSSMFYHADVIRRENSTGPSVIGKLDVTSFSANNHRLSPNEFSEGGPAFRAFPMFAESHPLVHSPEPPEEPWNSQKSYTLYERRIPMFDSSDDRMSPSTTKSSHSLVIKPPASVTTISTKGTVSSKSLENGSVAALNVNDVIGSHKLVKEKEFHLPQGLESKGSFLAPNQLSFQIGRTNDHMFVAPSSTKDDMSTKLSANDRLNFEFKARSSFQVPHINIPNANATENVKSAANSSEHFDHHNPAEDSPCWKGAPTSHFLPFGSPESTSPPHPTKKLQTGNGVNHLQVSQTDHSFNHSSTVHEISESNETMPGPIVQKQHTGEAVSVGFNSSKASSGGGARSVHDTIKPWNAHGFLNKSTSDVKLPNLDKDVISPEIKTGYGDAGQSIRSVEHVLVEDAAYVSTTKKVNASIFVKTLQNLSDLLLLGCSNDEYALKEEDHEALDHVIRNLNACVSRKVVMLPQQDTSNMSHEAAYVGKSQDTGGVFHHHQKQNSDNMEKLVECGSWRDEADPPKDDNMVQAIKKVLDENLECKEELPSQTLLYKNLWLEAEAELCSLNYRARFERMKRVTNKPTVSDASESSPATNKISSCNDSSPRKLQNQALSGGDRRNDDVEALVMARFNILKRRGESDAVNVQHEFCKDDAVVTGEHVEPLVKILKQRGEANAVDVDSEESGSSKPHFCNKEEAVGWYSGSGSDWEHILKDEFSWQGNGLRA